MLSLLAAASQVISMLVQIMALLKFASIIVEHVAMNIWLPPTVRVALKKKKNERVRTRSRERRDQSNTQPTIPKRHQNEARGL